MRTNTFIGGVLLVTLGCSSSNTPAPLAEGPTKEQTTACTDIVHANCLKRDACSNGNGNVTRYGDEATCEVREMLSCLQTMQAPGTARTAAGTEACVAALPTQSCADYFARNEPAACVYHGTVANGGVCNYGGQCQTVYCSFPLGGSCGTCAPQPNAGDACPPTNDCGLGLSCVAAVCVKQGGAASACAHNGECAAGLSCVGAAAPQKGTCQPAANAVGAACDPKAATGPFCDFQLRLWCSPTSKQCVAYAFASAGQPCGPIGDGFVQCTAGASCTIPMGAKSGTCTAAAADGATCDVTSGPFCLPPAACVTANGATTGTCNPPGRACR